MFSVIIPLYNKAAYISETLKSILNQTFVDFEVIIVDDGSTDTSLEVIKTFNDPRIHLICIPNSGVSIARNTGIQNAKFSWIAFLDADDWWAPNFLEAMVQSFKQFPNEKIFGTGRSRVFKDEVERYQNAFLPKNQETGLVNYFEIISKYLPPINSSNVVINKSLLINKGLFIEGMKQHEDHDLWLRICENNLVVFINKELSFYRKNIENTASDKGFLSQDFERYVTTITDVKKNLSEKHKRLFKQYYEKFITIRYFQNCYYYSKSEKEILYTLFKKSINKGKYRWLLWLIHNTSSVNLYCLLKKLKG